MKIMKQIKTKPFSATRSVVQRGTVAILCTILSCMIFTVGCKKDNSNTVKEPEYPIEIPFTEYTLSKTCQWKNLNYDNSVIIINNDEELQQHITSIDGIYPEIDFSEHTLLVTSGKTDNSISEISIINLLHLSEKEYELSVEINLKMVEVVKEWKVAILAKKVSEESKVSLKISLNEPEFTLKGTTWKLVGFVDTETGEVKEAEPINYERCYLITFNKDGNTFDGFSFNHPFCGRYVFDEGTSNINIYMEKMELPICERFDGDRYINSLNDIQSLGLQKNELRLYYNDKKNCLLFISIESPNEPNLLADTDWRLTSFMDVENGEIHMPDTMIPGDPKKKFVLTFNKDYELGGFSSSNRLIGRYILDEKNSNIHIIIWTQTFVCETPDGDLYIDALNGVQLQLFSFHENELKLFYNNGKNCLIFKKK